MQLKKYMQMSVSEVKSINDMRNGQSHTVKGKLDFAWYRYTADFHDVLVGYLDEKAILYDTVHSEMWEIDLALLGVPKRMYHQVVVPGMLHLCKQWKMIFNPLHYTIEGSTRTLEARIKPDHDKLWEAALKEYKDEHFKGARR